MTQEPPQELSSPSGRMREGASEWKIPGFKNLEVAELP